LKNYIICSKKPNIVWISDSLIEDRFDTNPFRAEYIQDEFYDTELYKTKSIEDVLRSAKDLTGGATPLGANYLTEGVRFIRTQDVDYNWIKTENAVFISEEDNKKLKRSVLEINDVLLTITGVNFGKSAPVRKECLPANISQHSVRMHFKDNLDAYYVSTFLNCIYGQKQILKRSVGVTRPAIDYSGIKSIIIPIPSPEIQKYIGDKVRKAEKLREEAKRLKKQAEEIIYKKLGNIIWEDEKNYTANYIREEDIFERIDSEYYKEKYTRLQKQLKSKGFSLKTLDELCDSNIFNGKTYKTTNKKRKYMNVGVGELGDWFILENRDKYIDENINTNYLLDRYSIIWGNSAHLAKYIGEKVNINLETNLYVPTTEITCIKPNLNKINPYYLFLYMKSNWGYYQIQRTVKGMTAHSYPEDVSKIIVPILDFSSVELNVMKSAIELGYRYTKESKQLVQEAKQDVEDLIEGNFDMSKVKANS